MTPPLTAVVTTSVVPRFHPETDHIDITVSSVLANLPDARVIVVADGLHRKYERDREVVEVWREYLDRLDRLAAERRWANVDIVRLPDWRHHANAFRAGLDLVETPLVLAMEHDTPLVTNRPIEWDGILATVEDGTAYSVRLHYDWRIHPDHERLLLDGPGAIHVQRPHGAPMVRTKQFSTRCHVASVEWYGRIFRDYIGPETRAFTEEVLHSVVENRVNAGGEAAWDEFRLWIYHPEGDTQRSLHLDTRPGGNEFAPVIVYEGKTPTGAPQPSWKGRRR